MDSCNLPDFLSLTFDLCAFRTGVVCPENEKLFERINRELPIKLHRYPSGSTFNGWQVPQSWRVERALLQKDGRLVFDGKANTLGVAAYSKPFYGQIEFEELKTHIVTNAQLPQAYTYHCMWQYRPWDADWALSMPHDIFKTLGPGRYTLDLATSFEPGEMLVADYEHKGRSERTIVFNCHTCHPHMANDAFASVAMLIRLFQWLKGRDTYYTYRLILGPEHLGTVFYLHDRTERELQNLVCGIFPEMPGTKGPLRVASTFFGSQPLDKAFHNAVYHYSKEHILVPWRHGAGNDETVWEAPGYEVPFVEVTRCLDSNFPFPEYHTNLDSPDLMDEDLMAEFYQVLQKVVETLEHNRFIHRRFNGLICLSNPEYNLYFERYDPAVEKDIDENTEKWADLLNSLFRYMDGSMTILDIAQKHGLPFDPLYRYLLKFEEKGLVHLEFAPIERLPISKMMESGRKQGE